MIYKQKPGRVNWEGIKEIFKTYDLEVKVFESTMKECYGSFCGDDWKIAVAQLIENLTKHNSRKTQSVDNMKLPEIILARKRLFKRKKLEKIFG